MIFRDRIKNYIINGNMDYWQRSGGISTTINTGAGTQTVPCDRWKALVNGFETHQLSIARSTDVPDSSSRYSEVITHLNTFSGSNANSYRDPMAHVIEGNVFRELIGKQATLSFWVKPNFTGVLPISFRNSVTSRSYVTTVPIVANVWQQKSVTLNFESSGFSVDNGPGLLLNIGGVGGTAFTTTQLNAWTNGNFITNIAGTNWAVGGNNIQITQIMLVEGDSVPSSFIYYAGDYASEFTACQRYFESSYAFDVRPGSSTTDGGLHLVMDATHGYGSFRRQPFAVIKRTFPTITTYNPATGLTGSARNTNTGTNHPTIVPTYAQNSVSIMIDNSGVAAVNTLIVHFTADAEF